jgi:uncharacterized RDD family membrane protein YckC
MKSWKTAAGFDFLKEALAEQKLEEEAGRGFIEKAMDKRAAGKGAGVSRTAFEYKHIPNPAGFLIRLSAAVFDWMLIGLFTLFLYWGANIFLFFSDVNFGAGFAVSGQNEPVATEELLELYPEPVADMDAVRPPLRSDDESKGFRENSLWKDVNTGNVYVCLNGELNSASWVMSEKVSRVFYALLTLWFFVVLLYFGLSLGLYAQTFGMWFWGIFIVKKDISEVYLLRAFYFTCLMFLLGFLTPFFVPLHPSRRSPHDILSGVRVIRIAGKPQA